MRFKKMSSLLVAGAIVFSTGISLTSCSNKIEEEQLLQIKELRKQERSLTKKLNTKKMDLSEINKELKSRQAVLDDCTKRQNFVKSKLDKWPNSWPDWSPEAEKKEIEETK